MLTLHCIALNQMDTLVVDGPMHWIIDNLESLYNCIIIVLLYYVIFAFSI